MDQERVVASSSTAKTGVLNLTGAGEESSASGSWFCFMARGEMMLTGFQENKDDESNPRSGGVETGEH